ncbi:sensor histidine kinase [Lachnoclostridium sp. Marseille-P6806]|uniref:sensor histidine kinase n=1 Tax=Lachnoclostridium sp. Marseille-P6806 TaxID=2364793 RepID=UPI00102FC290|nr:histidine kinase [Lachnoclostridium sp. Marseille-P6806]
MGKLHLNSYSFRGRLRRFFYLLYLVLIVVLLIYTFYITRLLLRNASTQQRQSLHLYCEQTGESLKDPKTYLLNLNSYSLDLSVAATRSRQEEIYNNLINIRNLFQQNVPSFSMIGGFYAYFPRNQAFVESNGSGYNSADLFPAWLRTQLRENADLAEKLQNENSRWVPVSYQEQWYFVLLCRQNESYVGAFIDSDSVTDRYEKSGGAGSITFFTDKNGCTVCVNGISEEEQTSGSDMAETLTSAEGRILPAEVALSRTLENFQVLSVNGTRYLVQSEPTGFSDLYLTVMTPYTSITGNFLVALKLLLFLFVLSLAVFFAAIRWSVRQLAKPVDLLQETTSAISAGDIHRRIDTSTMRAEEFIDIGNAFNSMVDTMEQLRVDAYENELERRSLELNLLKSQVSPHFFINCLGLIDLMADGTTEHSAIIHQMIERLSRHLRYILRARNRVPLSEELEYEQNYTEMTRLRFPGCLTVVFDIAPGAENAEVFPILLMNFTENTFKHNLVMGEPLSLTVRATVEESNGERRLHLIHIDSGEGFAADFLAKFNELAASDKPDWSAQMEGFHIGNWNVIRHLKLVYGETASIRFSNKPGSGARIDIDIPYREYQPEVSPSAESHEARWQTYD